MKGMGGYRRLAAAVACVLGCSMAQAAEQGISARFLSQNRVPMYAADGDTFVATDTIGDADGTQHVRMKRLYKGMEVIGGDVVVHSRQGVAVGDPSLTLHSTFRPSVTPSVSPGQVTAAVTSDFLKVTDFTARPGKVDSVGAPHLVIYARGGQPVLAYESLVVGQPNGEGSSVMRYFTDARTGEVLTRWNLIQSLAAEGTGKSILFGDVPLNTTAVDGSNGVTYQLIDSVRGNGSVLDGTGLDVILLAFIPHAFDSATVFTSPDNIWGDGTAANRQSAAADIAHGVSAAWDYYHEVHHREGILGDGAGVKSYAHVSFIGSSLNAVWADLNDPALPEGNDIRGMLYGDGGQNGDTTFNPFVAMDVAGHEMTHGVTGATAKLAPEQTGEPGALNESTSDIFGTMVEFHANDPHEPPNYLIGEKLFASNPDGTLALRYMFKPSLGVDTVNGEPVASADCWDATVGQLNAHYASGVGNHFFYLLAEGDVVPEGFGVGTKWNLTPDDLVCNAKPGPGQRLNHGSRPHLRGVGRDVAQKIWYRALTVYMTSDTDYADARIATLNATRDLYPGLVKVVDAAWAAVNVH